MEETLRRYFQCWLDQDDGPLKDIFSNDIVYSECYGPEYRGLAQVLQWFRDWNRTGRVLRWDVKQVLACGRTAVVEWYFACDAEGQRSAFDGVTLAEFDGGGKIVSLKEFQSKAEHCCPYGRS